MQLVEPKREQRGMCSHIDSPPLPPALFTTLFSSITSLHECRICAACTARKLAKDLAVEIFGLTGGAGLPILLSHAATKARTPIKHPLIYYEFHVLLSM
jgi:hypothetical protein